jgi:hypothetical protein
LVLRLNYKIKRLGILERPATAQAQEGCADSVGTGSIETPANLVLKKIKMDWYTETTALHQETARDERS